MNNIDKHISKKFKHMRKLYGFTQEDIASILDCSRINVVRMEKGQTGFTSKTIYILCITFQCAPDDLLPPAPLKNKYRRKAESILKNK